jgi:hypothetical protein
MKLGSNISAVITGGASGLGAATARCLASNGVRVGIFNLNEEVRKALADELSGVFSKANATSSGGNTDQHDSTGHLRYAAVGAGILMLPVRDLDLFARDVLAAATQIVLCPVHEEEVSILVEHSKVARMKPRVSIGAKSLVRTAPIPFKHAVRLERAHHDFTNLARTDLSIVVIKYPGIEICVALSGTARLRPLCPAGKVGDQVAFRQTVSRHASHLETEPLNPNALNVRWHRQGMQGSQLSPALEHLISIGHFRDHYMHRTDRGHDSGPRLFDGRPKRTQGESLTDG